MINAVIFDFDGLILDTETPDYLSWQETYAAFGCELPLDLWQQNIGAVNLFNPYTYLEELLGRPIDRQAVHAQRKQRDNELLAQQPVMPGVEAYLAAARSMGLKLAVASSSDHSWVDGHLARLGLSERFDAVLCRDDVNGRSKPDPAVYEAALSVLSTAPRQALALEDSPNGVLAARQAGVWCTAVPNQMTRGLMFDHADYCLDSLADVPLQQLIQTVVGR